MSHFVRPLCIPCQDHQHAEPATFVAAQSSDAGKTVAWTFVCDVHADGWNEGGDWIAPLYPIGQTARIT